MEAGHEVSEPLPTTETSSFLDLMMLEKDSEPYTLDSMLLDDLPDDFDILAGESGNLPFNDFTDYWSTDPPVDSSDLISPPQPAVAYPRQLIELSEVISGKSPHHRKLAIPRQSLLETRQASADTFISPSSQSKHRCPICSLVLTRSYDLRRHLINIHADKTNISKTGQSALLRALDQHGVSTLSERPGGRILSFGCCWQTSDDAYCWAAHIEETGAIEPKVSHAQEAEHDRTDVTGLSQHAARPWSTANQVIGVLMHDLDENTLCQKLDQCNAEPSDPDADVSTLLQAIETYSLNPSLEDRALTHLSNQGIKAAHVMQGAAAISELLKAEEETSADFIVRGAHVCQMNGCGKTFEQTSDLRRHQSRYHQSQHERPHECSLCDVAYAHRKDLHRHSVEKHQPAGLVCKMCGRIFRRKDNLARHVRKLHENHGSLRNLQDVELPKSLPTRHRRVATIGMSLSSPPPAAKPNFWRIQNIKASEKADAKAWLQEQVKDLAITEGCGFSLALDSGQTLCATLTSFERPTPASHDWRVDGDFVGFTPLCDPDDANVDVVAVTGPGGHALRSFCSTEGFTVWLRDFTPEDIPRARLVTYGYDSAVAANDAEQGVSDLAYVLLDGLANFRRETQTQQRPICFICHSLGGVVLKAALVKASMATEPKYRELSSILLATRGLLLMGVPNLGLKHSQLEAITYGRPNPGFTRDVLVRSDGEHSQFLDYLAQEFTRLDLTKKPPFNIVSYYETRSSPTIVSLGGGQSAITGPKELMVTKASAERMSRIARDISLIASDTDHRGLVKFDHSQDVRYKSVAAQLKSMVASAGSRTIDPRAVTGMRFVGQTRQQLMYIPFPRNRKFVGRSTELEVLERKLFVERDCHSVAVVGLGGVGKTQVVLQFAYTVLERHPDVSVFWAPATSVEAFEQAYKEIANILGLAIAADAKADVKVLVREELDTRTDGKWLLIVDNADDLDVLEGAGKQGGLREYLPKGDSGLTIFTTRTAKVAQTVARSDVVKLGNPTVSESEDIMERSLVRRDMLNDKAVIASLLFELDYLPLAVTQAAAFMNENEVSISEYLAFLKGTEQDLIEVMSAELSDNTRYKESSNAVATTWLISFQRMQHMDPQAAELLQYMACIDYKAIPLSILPVANSKVRMVSAIGTLRAYSFVSKRSGSDMYDMHRLVHLAARIWMRASGSLAGTHTRALSYIEGIFPSDDWENRELWREYMPHAVRIANEDQGGDEDTRGNLCLCIGRCMRIDGRIKDAVEWLERSYEYRKALPEDHPSRLHSQHELARAYEANGQVAEAVQLLEHVVAIKKRVLAEDHPDRLASQHELARAYEANGQVVEAVQLLEHVVAIKERVIGEDHPDRLVSQQLLARAYRANGQVHEAVELLEHVVAMQERVLAEDHPDRLKSQYALAGAYQTNGQVHQAIELLEHVVAIQERVLAEDHPDRLASQHQLAGVYQSSGHVEEAVKLLEFVVAIQERVLAEDHPSRLVSQHNLAGAYEANGQVEKAVQLLEHVVAIQRQWLAEEHPSRLSSQHNLAFCIWKLRGPDEEALQLLKHVVTIQKRSLREDHPHRLQAEESLAEWVCELEQRSGLVNETINIDMPQHGEGATNAGAAVESAEHTLTRSILQAPFS